MDRVLEPELMLQPDQVKAYAEADFSEPHEHFITLITADIGANYGGYVLDLGCGPGDISRRFALANPACQIHAVDGSEPMLSYGKTMITDQLLDRISFILARLPVASLPCSSYDLIISNSLLHHLPDAKILWNTIKQFAKPGSRVCIMDLLRPATEKAAISLVHHYAADEAEILQHDFYYSLLAAFTQDEIKIQLQHTQLDFSVQQVSDRHVYVSGIF